MSKRVELLAPAGNPEKLEIAIHYGADAVYLAGKEFSLRNFSGNFTLEEIKNAIDFSHSRGVKVYVACNVYVRNNELDAIRDYLATLAALGPDALIVSDLAVFAIAREVAPKLNIHISTQANTTNWRSARFWKELGASRINTARELTLEEIRAIAQRGQVEVESFVHGAMCISYSGRCLLSSFLAGRDANRGECTQPCRWKYSVVEEKRPGQYLPIMEDERGSYIFNSKDLCMIEHIPALIEAGITSLKIEGRMKGIGYLAPVIKTYREAIDAYYENNEIYKVRDEWLGELSRINSWGYSKGFYFGGEVEAAPNQENARPNTIYRFAGKVLSSSGTMTKIDVRNKIEVGDKIEVLTRKGVGQIETVTQITDLNGCEIKATKPNTTATLALSKSYSPNDLIRIAKETTYVASNQGPGDS